MYLPGATYKEAISVQLHGMRQGEFFGLNSTAVRRTARSDGCLLGNCVNWPPIDNVIHFGTTVVGLVLMWACVGVL